VSAAACAPPSPPAGAWTAGAPPDGRTWQPPERPWPEGPPATSPRGAPSPHTTRRALRSAPTRIGDVHVLEGDTALVGGAPGAWGLALDAPNHLAAITAALEATLGPLPGVVLVATSFDDRGAGGAGYYEPIAHDGVGTGRAPLDRRAEFGVEARVGVANVKQLSRLPAPRRVPLVVHELAHRDLAHLAISPLAAPAGPPVTTILGRQGAHWHAALASEGSVLEGHGLTRAGTTADGRERFRVGAVNAGLSALDRYGLGLLEAEDVPPTFFVADARSPRGAAIPPAAQLARGSTLSGFAVPITIDDVVAATGRRPLDPDGRLCVTAVLLTAPDQAATSSVVDAERAVFVEALDGARAAYAAWTSGRGRLVDAADCRASPSPSGAPVDAPPASTGCRSAPTGHGGLAPIVAALALVARARRRRLDSPRGAP
jgi:hypothetical protein